MTETRFGRTEKLICSACGKDAEIDADEAFCPSCGSNIDWDGEGFEWVKIATPIKVEKDHESPLRDAYRDDIP